MNRLQESESKAPKAVASIRAADRADLPSIRDLLSERDGRPWSQADTDWFLCRLDPERCLAWLAFVDGKAVGLTSMYVRTLRVGGVRGRERRVGYWANLYIGEGYRDHMLYPRLPMAMTAALKPTGLEFLYACVRQRDVAATHLRIGFGQVGRMRVLIKPLRPGRLIAKHKKMPRFVRSMAVPIDFVFRAALKRSRRGFESVDSMVDLFLDSESTDQVVDLFNRADEQRISQRWTPESLRSRFEQTREGGRYELLGVERNGELNAAAIWRMAERGKGIRAGVVMDAAWRGDEQAIGSALIEAERRVYRNGGELMIFLDGAGPAGREVMEALEYRVSPETYDMLVWPKSVLAAEPALADLNQWRFSFGDHDAF